MSVAKTGTFDRDKSALWYAKRHLETDTGVEEIYHLPTDAPPTEIRFLEVNSMIAEQDTLEPIDFGVDIGDAEGHTLVVLDVTPDQWNAIQKGELRLPSNWTLAGKQLLEKRKRR
jgi:hypothetical protein